MADRFHRALVACLLLLLASTAFAQDEERAYTEGPVTVVSFVKIKPGMFDAYMRYLQKTYKTIMEEQKKAGVVMSYGVYTATAHNPHEADLYLTITYKNWAAFDTLTEATEVVQKKVWGSLSKSDAAAVDREKLREILGSEVIQELALK